MRPEVCAKREVNLFGFVLIIVCTICFVCRNGGGDGWHVCDVCSPADWDVSVVCQAKWRGRKSGEVNSPLTVSKTSFWSVV